MEHPPPQVISAVLLSCVALLVTSVAEGGILGENSSAASQDLPSHRGL